MIKKIPLNPIFLLLTHLLICPAFSQNNNQDTLSTLELKPVTILSTRIKMVETDIPISITTIPTPSTNSQQLSIKEIIDGTPGVFLLNENNFAQDVRISIRGFGSRAAFGIRGVKIVLDGIPESTPDGQGQIDNIDPGFLGATEIIRSPASGLYGNAAGGVITFKTRNIDKSFSEIRLTGGSFGFQKYQITSGLKKNNFNNVAFLSHTRINGYRAHSKFYSTLFNNKLNISPNKKDDFIVLLNYSNSPVARDPGGLTIDEVNQDRTQARNLNVQQNTGESVEQGRIGLSYSRELNNYNSIDITGFYTFREFYGKIPFAIIDLQRDFYGFNSSYEFNKNDKTIIKAGFDLQFQNDHRLNFNNNEGNKGALFIDQHEKFYNTAFYVISEFSPLENLAIFLNLRYDHINIRGDDNYLSDGNDTGEKSFNRFNPLIGMNYSVSKAISVFANFSTGFETPALSELSSNPTGKGGFNNDLEPQFAINLESGIKGIIWDKAMYSLSIFRIETENELIPYQTEQFPDREFYENAGSTIRNGIEAGLDLLLTSNFNASVSYTYSNFKFDQFISDGDNYNDNQIPGIPQNLLSIGLDYSTNSGLKISSEFQLVGKLYADNGNSVDINQFAMINISGSQAFSFNKWNVEPFLGINNILNTKYFSNIRINAFGGKYYEPAPGINFYGGVRIKLNH